MRAVLLGSDLMYDRSGRLVPIEINTNVGYDNANRVETTDEWLDLSELVTYVQEEGFEKVTLDISSSLRNSFRGFERYLREALQNIVEVAVTDVEGYEAEESELYIRVRFDDEALIDSFCRDKVAFLSVISESPKIGQEFLYKENGEVKGNMGSFFKGGEDPNYIVKYRYPHYSSSYPKYYKLKSLKGVQKLAESLEDGYLIMPCYLNEENMYSGERFILIRQWSLIVSDREKTAKAINLGSYTKLSGKIDRSQNEFDETTGELLKGRENYLTKDWVRSIKDVLLEEGDQVLMSDGTWKNIELIQKEESVLSVDVPHAEDVDIRKHIVDLNVSEEEFKENSRYRVSEIKTKSKVESFQNIVHITFVENEEEWWDSEHSSYPVRNGSSETVKFLELKDITVGNKIYLIDLGSSTDENSKVTFVERTIKDTWVERKLIEGYTLSLTGPYLFISKAETNTTGYASVEHNSDPVLERLCSEKCFEQGYNNYEVGVPGFCSDYNVGLVCYKDRCDDCWCCNS